MIEFYGKGRLELVFSVRHDSTEAKMLEQWWKGGEIIDQLQIADGEIDCIAYNCFLVMKSYDVDISGNDNGNFKFEVTTKFIQARQVEKIHKTKDEIMKEYFA